MRANHFEPWFRNSIVGHSDAVSVDGIRVGEQLGFDVSCLYSDHFELEHSADIASGGHITGGQEDVGAFTGQFRLQSFVDSDFSVISSADTPLVVGQSVFNRVSVSGSIPSNINFVVTDCWAQDDNTQPTLFYNIIRDGCLDRLLQTSELNDDLVGDGVDPVDFKFNGFTFAATADTIYLKCSVSLCATSGGELVEPGCGLTYGGDSCAAYSADSTMGYSIGSGY